MDKLLHTLLTKTAQKEPEKIAVEDRDQTINYKQLDFLSSQLSSFLIKQNVKIGDRIGLYLDKSIDALISIFGILKSGACYVPLDPMGPIERVTYIINECGMEYLIISSTKTFKIKNILTQSTSLKGIIIVDKRRDEIPVAYSNTFFKDTLETMNTRTRPSFKNTNPAYIFFTSGSTGKPKGVMISHKASLTFVNWAYEYFKVSRRDRISAHAPFYFDLSIFDIFVTIKAGATLCIIPQGMSAFPKSLAAFIEEKKISIWYSVPSVLIQLILYGNLEAKNLSSLKKIIYAGEEFPVKYLKKLMDILPLVKYFNLYGPTETNVCTYYPIDPPALSGDSVPIGKPIKGVETFVLKENGALAGKGEKGELYVSGPILMTGYWNDPLKTRSVLFRSPFHPGKNVKIYKTGDTVKIDRDGRYLFSGRRDHMIKSRGYRIQLEEIEIVLNKHPEIEKAIAVAIDDEIIGKKIKAVISVKSEITITEKEIKHFCSKELPQYMIPEIIEFRKNLPKTSTGKIGRSNLT